MDLDPDAEFAELTDRLVQIDFALVDANAELLELPLDVAGRDRAVQLVFLADFHGEAELHAGKASRFGFRRRLLGGALLGDALAFVGDLLLVGVGRRIGEPFGKQVIAGVPVLHLHDLADFAKMLDVFPQNDFHPLNPSGLIGDRKSTRLNSSHLVISYAVFCLKKKKKTRADTTTHTVVQQRLQLSSSAD